MKKLVVGILLGAFATVASADTSVAVTIGQPGFYGQIILGDAYPAPRVVYAKPVIVHRPAVVVVEPPLYLRVPPGHMKNWSRYCGRYQACGRQVYFVQDAWYQNEYAPRYNERKGHGRDHDRGWDDHGKSKEHGKHGHGHDRD